MNVGSGICPGCGAHVYPEETHCPYCGRGLRNRFVTVLAIGLGGLAVALVAGAAVWFVLTPSGEGSAPAVQTAQTEPAAPSASAPSSTASAAQEAASPAPNAATAQSAPPSDAALGSGPAASPLANMAGGAPLSHGLPNAAADPLSLSYSPDLALRTDPSPPGTDDANTANLALPKPSPGADQVPTDAAGRRAFAKSTQANFTQNGLDLVVYTSGEEDKDLTIKFSFPAKTAVELIVGGPFPRQCRTRGFQRVFFIDPAGVVWTFDVENETLTQK